MNTAQTILEQLGGNKFVAMVGGHSAIGGERTLQIKFRAKASNGANTLRIKLDVDDTYILELWKIRGMRMTLIHEISGQYAADLVPCFRHHTGLDTSL